MILGECTSCNGWVVNPTTEKCAYCFNKVSPLKALILHDVPDGTRIDVQASKLFDVNNEVIYDRQIPPDRPGGKIEYLRKILHAYDEGHFNESFVSYEVFFRTIRDLVDSLKKSGKLMWFTSACRRDAAPLETIRVEITIQGSDITVTPFEGS